MIGVVLLSGGIDSAVTLGIALDSSDEVLAIHFDYGQTTRDRERENSEKLADYMGVELVEADVREAFSNFCSGTMVKKNYNTDGVSDRHGHSTGYVHMRNLILLSIAGAIADSRYSDKKIDIYLGAQRDDEELYPDCRPEFINATEDAINSSTNRNRISIKAPLIDKTKEDVIKKANDIGVPLEYTVSCYNLPEGKPCLECPACIERKKGFEEAGIEDPAR